MWVPPLLQVLVHPLAQSARCKGADGRFPVRRDGAASVRELPRIEARRSRGNDERRLFRAHRCGRIEWHEIRKSHPTEAPVGRALEAARTRDVARLFAFFGVSAQPELVEAHRTAITTRFALEVQEIVRLCSNLRERERFTLLREALRLSYDRAVGVARAVAT